LPHELVNGELEEYQPPLLPDYIYEPSTTCPYGVQAANLQKLAMVWGFTKYTHMVFLTGERCWDAELLYLIPIVRFAEPDDVNDILYNWLISLGDDGFDNNQSAILLLPMLDDDDWLLLDLADNESWLSQITTRSDNDHLSFVIRADKNRLKTIPTDCEYFGWLHSLVAVDGSYMQSIIDMSWLTDESFLGYSLAATFARFTETPVIDMSNAPVFVNGFVTFTNQNPYPDMDFEDVGYRLLGLFRLWNAMKYFFPYIDIIDGDWHDILLEHIPKMLEATDELSYHLTLMSLAAGLNDAHVGFSNILNVFDDRFGRYALPARLIEAEGELVVAYEFRIHPFWQGMRLLPGDVITKANGRDVGCIVTEKLKYISHSNEETALADIANAFLPLRQHTSDTSMELYVIRDGAELRVDVEVAPSLRINYRQFARVEMATYQRLDGDIGLINPRMLNAGEIHDIMEYFADTSGLIIDMRQRPGYHGFTSDISEYFVESRQHFVSFMRPAQVAPGMFIGFRQYVGGPINDRAYFYEGNVVILMNERTMSFPETVVMALRNGANVTVLGSNSMGANGDTRFLPLPGGTSMAFSSIGVFTPDGGQTQRIGLEPDIYVHRTIAGIRDGRDELLEAAVSYLLTGNPFQR